jgi:hypothetical protein
MSESETIRKFFRDHRAAPVGAALPQPLLSSEDEAVPERIELEEERAAADWQALPVSEAPARAGEYPERFIDGSQTSQPVLWLQSPEGWPIPLVLAEVGAAALRLEGRRFIREFLTIERVLSFVADPFPWEEVEAFAGAVMNNRHLQLRVVRANPPGPNTHSLFDYEAMRTQAREMCTYQMRVLERLALFADRTVPTLIDGPLLRVIGEPSPESPLIIGVAKQHGVSYLHAQGWRVLLSLPPGRRTPVFKIVGVAGERQAHFSVASWYLKLAGGPRLAPNWGFVRVEVPWNQFLRFGSDRFGFVDRLSRWLIDARCRQDSYARMPVSLEPIVRAEEALRPLFTPLDVLAHRLYRQAGMFRSHTP